MEPATVTGYRATRTDKELVIHDVEVFASCERDDFKADSTWIKAAFKKAQAEAAEGYHPPLHVRHHERDTEVRAAGWFEVTEIRQIKLGGRNRSSIVVDYHVTDEQIAQDLIDGKLPHRSVEIFDVDAAPSIDGLALLDHEAPFLRLPMLKVESVDRVMGNQIRPLAARAARFRQGHCINPLEQHEVNMSEQKPAEDFGTGVDGEPLTSGHITTSTTFTPPADSDGPLTFEFPAPAEAKPAPAAAAKPEAEAEGEEEAEGVEPEGVKACVGAIQAGTISIADFAAIREAMQAAEAAQQPQQQPQQPQQPVAQVPPPGGATMKAEPTENAAQFAAQQGEIDALKAQASERDEKDVRKDDVAEAIQLLAGRPMGADLEARLEAFHTEHGPAAFKAYIDSMSQTFGVAPEKETSSAFQASGGVPDLCMKYQEKGGSAAVDQAAQFCADYDELVGHGQPVRQTKERWVELSMNRSALTAQEN